MQNTKNEILFGKTMSRLLINAMVTIRPDEVAARAVGTAYIITDTYTPDKRDINLFKRICCLRGVYPRTYFAIYDGFLPHMFFGCYKNGVIVTYRNDLNINTYEYDINCAKLLSCHVENAIEICHWILSYDFTIDVVNLIIDYHHLIEDIYLTKNFIHITVPQYTTYYTPKGHAYDSTTVKINYNCVNKARLVIKLCLMRVFVREIALSIYEFARPTLYEFLVDAIEKT